MIRLELCIEETPYTKNITLHIETKEKKKLRFSRIHENIVL